MYYTQCREKEALMVSVSKYVISLCVNLYSYILHQFFNPLEYCVVFIC